MTVKKNISLANFLFADSASGNIDAAGFKVLIPRNVRSKEDLFRALLQEFKFPYFGANWDALRDCLRDLSWISEDRIVVVHEDLPILPKLDLQHYLEILSEAVDDWTGDSKEFLVVFPVGVRGPLREFVGDDA
jgi:RNAse (barnase) inhibitor barstar